MYRIDKKIFLIKLTSIIIALLYAILFFITKYFSIQLLFLTFVLIICAYACLKKIISGDFNINISEDRLDKCKQLGKKLSISLVLYIALFMITLVLSLNYYFIFNGYLSSDIFRFFNYPYLGFSGIGMYFVLKNIFLVCSIKFSKGYFISEELLKIKRVILLSLFYYSIVIFIQFIYYWLIKETFIIKFFLVAIMIYLIMMFLFIFFQYKEVKTNSFINTVKRVTIVFFGFIFLCYYVLTADYWHLQPYISTIPQVSHSQKEILENPDGSYSIIMDDEDFKILQLTDIHLGGTLYTYGEDKNALMAVYDLISYTKPDLVVVTGDFVFSVGLFSLSFNNYSPIQQFCSFMRNIGIPWTFVYGNHDTEEISTASFQKVDDLFKKYTYSNTHSLLYSAVRPKISGRYNQYIKILNKDHSINQVLFLLDSNQYIGSMTDYDFIRDDQVEWYEDVLLSLKNDKIPNSMIFCHIPLEEYKDAYRLYQQNSEKVKYYFGEIGETGGAISTSKYNSQLFETAKKLGSTKAIFVGHDHYNNISLEYDGIRLTFGRSIDYLAMPGINQETFQRGGTLITLHPDNSFTIDSIKLDDLR